METQGNTKTPVMGCITVCADSVRSGNMVTEGIGMSDSIRACEERIKDLTEQINAVNDRLAELKEQMLAVQQSLESTFILAFGKKKELRAELDVLTGREKTLLEQRRVLQDKLSDARIDKVMAEEAAAQAIIEAQKRAEAELARIIAEEQARNKDFEIQDGVLIKYTGDDTDVTIPDGVTSIGEKAFESSKVRNVVIPHGVTSIGNSAFAYCWKLESIKLPDTLTEIGEHAFTCTGVKDIVIPNMVTRIGSFAFNTCIYLEHIKLPPSLTAISLSLFSSCRQLKRIVIPESIKEIGTFAFHDCPVLESFVIPEGVKTIKYHTFNACSNLVHIGIPASVTEIDKEAFEGCKKLVATVKPGSYAEKFCRQGRIRYFYSDGSAPAAPPPHAEAKPASSTLPATNAAAKTPATSAATMKAKEPTPTRAAQLEQTGVFDLSQVPESIRPQLSRLLNNLLSAYPDKVVSGLSRDHGHWAETLTKLYKELGYPSGQALLEAYGFVVEKSVGGRPSKDHTAVIEELRKLYPQPFVGTVSALSKAHPELASRIKTLTNSAQILFGMSLSDYLKQEGIITTNQPKAQKKETVPAVQQAPEKSLKEKADEVIAELKKRYPNIMTAPKTITQLKEDNPDISFDTLSSRVRTAYKMPLKEFLVSMELLKGNVSTKEKTSGENGRVYWEEAFTRTILTRGLEYYHTGKVHLTESSHEKYAATVSGSEEYEVSIQLAQGIVTKMQCNCPYAGDGLRCKHMAAVLYAVTKGQELFCAKEVITEVSRSNQPVQSMPAPVLASEPTERLDELFDVVQVESPKKKRNLSDASEAAFKRYEFAFKAGIWFRGPSAVIKKILWQYRDVCQPEPIEACGKGIAQVYVLFSLSNQVRVFDMMRQYSVLRVTCFAGIRYDNSVLYSESGSTGFTRVYDVDCAKDEGNHWMHTANVLEDGKHASFDTRSGETWKSNYRFPFRKEWEQEQFLLEEEGKYYNVIPRTPVAAQARCLKNASTNASDNSVSKESWQTLFTKTILQRGLKYQQEGAVEIYYRSEDRYSASVEGSDTYDVDVLLHANGEIMDSLCDCPYFMEEGKWCKHIAATLYQLEEEGVQLYAKTESTQPTQKKTTAPAQKSSPDDVVSCKENQMLIVTTDKSKLQELQEEYGCGPILQSDSAPEYFYVIAKTDPLGNEHTLPFTTGIIARSFAGCGMIYEFNRDADHEEEGVFFFDGRTLWGKNGDVGYELAVGMDNVDPEDWLIDSYDTAEDEEDDAEDDWGDEDEYDDGDEDDEVDDDDWGLTSAEKKAWYAIKNIVFTTGGPSLKDIVTLAKQFLPDETCVIKRLPGWKCTRITAKQYLKDKKESGLSTSSLKGYSAFRGPAYIIDQMIEELEIEKWVECEYFSNGVAQIICPPDITRVAQKILPLYPALRFACFNSSRYGQDVLYSETGDVEFSREHYLDGAKNEGEHWVNNANVLIANKYSAHDLRTGSRPTINYVFPFQKAWDSDEYLIEEKGEHYLCKPNQ